MHIPLDVVPRRADFDALPPRRGHSRAARAPLLAAIIATIGIAPIPARAVDGCLVMLCLAAPSWKAIPECVPPVRQLFRDLARGKPFPSCSTTGNGSSVNHHWSDAPTFCPPQYTRALEMESSVVYRCDYAGAITVQIDGAPFARTWWSFDGDSVTEFGPDAKVRLGSWDPRFDDEHARWAASQTRAQPPSKHDGP